MKKRTPHTKNEIEWHRKAHRTLDQIAACYAHMTGRGISKTTVMELLMWNARQFGGAVGGNDNIIVTVIK